MISHKMLILAFEIIVQPLVPILDTFFDKFCQVLMFLEDSMGIFYGTKGLKLIDFTIINWFQALSTIKNVHRISKKSI